MCLSAAKVAQWRACVFCTARDCARPTLRSCWLACGDDVHERPSASCNVPQRQRARSGGRPYAVLCQAVDLVLCRT